MYFLPIISSLYTCIHSRQLLVSHHVWNAYWPNNNEHYIHKHTEVSATHLVPAVSVFLVAGNCATPGVTSAAAGGFRAALLF